MGNPPVMVLELIFKISSIGLCLDYWEGGGVVTYRFYQTTFTYAPFSKYSDMLSPLSLV